VPHAISKDLEPGTMDSARAGPLWPALLGRQFRFWADRRGSYIEGTELIGSVLDLVSCWPIWPALKGKQFYLWADRSRQ
jgi:hypothetical protein